MLEEYETAAGRISVIYFYQIIIEKMAWWLVAAGLFILSHRERRHSLTSGSTSDSSSITIEEKNGREYRARHYFIRWQPQSAYFGACHRGKIYMYTYIKQTAKERWAAAAAECQGNEFFNQHFQKWWKSAVHSCSK
jgi:hypothetical protein